MNKLYKAIGLAVLILLLINAATAQTSTSATYPGTASGWTNATNANASDGAFTTWSSTAGSTSPELLVSGFGFSIPVDAIIKGVTVRISKKSSVAGGKLADYSLQLIKAGSATGNDKANTSTKWGTTNSATSYGSTSDLWGNTLTPADVNASGFGVSFKAQNTDNLSITASVDYVSVTVTYQPITDYRTAASGNWNSTGTWQASYDNGTSWVSAPSTPSTNAPSVVQNGHTVTVTANATVDQVTVTSGGQLVVNSAVTLTINNGSGTDMNIDGTLTNNGTVTNNGAISFGQNGVYIHNRDGGSIPTATWAAASTTQVNGVTTTLPGGLSQTFGNMIMNLATTSTTFTLPTAFNGNLEIKNGSKFNITANSAISGTLIMTSGSLDLGNYTMVLGGISGGSATSYVKTSGTGKLKMNLPNAASVTFPVGMSNYAPATITNNTGTADSFSLRVLDEVYINGLTGSIANGQLRVKHTWDIGKGNSSANAGSGINITVNWNGSDAQGSFTPALYHYSGTGWNLQPLARTSTGTNSLTFTGYMGSFSPFVVMSSNSSLPVIWRSFDVQHSGADAFLTWVTSSEENTRDFEVQHSLDGAHWETIAKLEAAGNSTTERTYHYSHKAINSGVHHYRIKQTDLDGKFGFSAVVSINMNGASAISLKAFPNPATSSLTLTHDQAKAGTVCRVIAMDGKVMEQSTVAANAIVTRIDLSRLKPGLYIISLESEGNKQIQKVQKL